jgi:hypothetical protein
MPDVLVAIDKESPAASGGNAAGASMAALLREGPTRSKITLRRIEIRRDEAGLCREKSYSGASSTRTDRAMGPSICESNV